MSGARLYTHRGFDPQLSFSLRDLVPVLFCTTPPHLGPIPRFRSRCPDRGSKVRDLVYLAHTPFFPRFSPFVPFGLRFFFPFDRQSNLRAGGVSFPPPNLLKPFPRVDARTPDVLTRCSARGTANFETWSLVSVVGTPLSVLKAPSDFSDIPSHLSMDFATALAFF